MRIGSSLNYMNIITTLKATSAIATFSTFIRVLNTRRFPSAFLLLPTLLVFLLAFERSLSHDRHMKCVFTGATVGLVAGFLSDADKLVNLGSIEVKSSKGIFKEKHNKENSIHEVSSFHQLLSALELLHIPVLAGSIVYTFCSIFCQLPPVRLIVLSLALSVCCSIIISLIAIILEDMHHSKLKSSFYTFQSYIDLRILFILIFTISMLPSIHGVRRRSWILLFNIFTCNILWQSDHLDSVQWQAQSATSVGRFPIAGCVSSIFFIFTFHCLQPFISKRRVLFWTEEEDQVVDEDTESETNAFVMWYCGAFVVERLMLMYASQLRKVTITHDQRIVLLASMDCWLTCLLIMSAAYLFSMRHFVGMARTVLILVLLNGLYFCVGVIGGLIINGHFVDLMFGLSFLVLM